MARTPGGAIPTVTIMLPSSAPPPSPAPSPASSPASSPAPSTVDPPVPGRRLRSLDVLRGIAIIGTLASNIWIFTQLPMEADTLRFDIGRSLDAALGSAWASVDSAVGVLSEILVNGKFLALLSILFGVGMAIQFDAARRHGFRWPWRYQWRSLLLLADGFLHFVLVFEFDILMGYALAAMVVAPLLLLRGWRLVAVTVLIGLVHLGLHLSQTLAMHRAVRREWVDERFDTVISDLVTASNGGYLDQVAYRLANFWDLRVEAFMITPALTAFLFLVGAQLWRAGLFSGDAWARRTSRLLALGGLGIGLPLSVLPTLGLLPAETGFTLAGLGRYVIAPVVAFGYLGLVLVLLERRGGDGFVSRRLAEVGRTALSCYILQNVIASVAFYSWGLELGPLGSVGTVLAWAVISAILMALAHLWLRRFRQGPFEASWRWLADAPFRRTDRARV
jgi:uncharacterized protein